jgi:hypothetical protein
VRYLGGFCVSCGWVLSRCLYNKVRYFRGFCVSGVGGSYGSNSYASQGVYIIR